VLLYKRIQRILSEFDNQITSTFPSVGNRQRLLQSRITPIRRIVRVQWETALRTSIQEDSTHPISHEFNTFYSTTRRSIRRILSELDNQTTPEHSRVHRPLGSAHISAKVIDALNAETERQRQERRDRTDTHILSRSSSNTSKKSTTKSTQSIRNSTN
jgi:hypothetical protein